MTYIIIAIAVSLVIACIYKLVKTEEKNMDSDEFIMRCPKAMISIMYAGCIFFVGFGIYLILNPTDVDQARAGYLFLIMAFYTFLLGQMFASIKTKVDSKTIQSTHFIRRKPLIINFSEITLAKYEKVGKNAVLQLYDEDNKLLFKAGSSMVGFSLLVERVRAINCEFVDKSKQPKK